MLTSRLLAGTVVAVFTLAACGAAAAPSAAGPSDTPQPTPTAVPGDPGNGGGSGGTTPGGGGTDPGSGSGIPIPGDPGSNPLFGKATYVTPGQGLVDLHPVNVQLVRAVVNADGSVTTDLRWWSGIAPCTQLSAVQITRGDDAKTIRMQVIEGSGGGQVACIDIAQLTATQVDLGRLASGAWKISADGDAPAITLVVP